ncbi:MAG TPA: DinB family protein [Dehalococcoidia bacterium]|nr:DinB family protein [Dehalococcoidia bacterium]
MNEAATIPADKAAIRAELERTHDGYRELVAAIPDAKWHATSGNRAFTVGQLASHLAGSVDFTIGLIEAARKGKQTNVPSFLMPLGYKLNEIRIRRGASKATRDSVLAAYDGSQARLLRLLDDVSDAELAIVKTNFGDTQSVREMFKIPVEHLAEHAPDIRAAL